MPLTNTRQFYSGGLAEIVDKPSEKTFSYLQKWFSTNNALGKALSLLKLPYVISTKSVLTLESGELFVNLSAEEAVLYSHTVFKYATQNAQQEVPKLVLDPVKIFNPICWFGTIKLILIQSYWIAKPDQLLTKLDEMVKDIPVFETTDRLEIENILETKVVPIVTAVGMLNEYYFHLIKNEHKAAFENIFICIDSQVKDKDWFYTSINDQLSVQVGKISFNNYLKKYGIRADNDFELTCPRWYEIPEEIKKRIADFKKMVSSRVIPILPYMSPDKRKHIDTYISLLLMRSEAKKLMLIWIDLLRKAVLLDIKQDVSKPAVKTPKSSAGIAKILHHQGTPISTGKIQGIVQTITSPNTQIKNGSIGIFPNASTQFSNLFPKCAGIIFLKGGQTSHGAIVAREFGIPALTDKNAEELTIGQKVLLDGGNGKWHLIE